MLFLFFVPSVTVAKVEDNSTGLLVNAIGLEALNLKSGKG